MKSTETGVLSKSDLYFSSPSQTSKRLFYYVISAGHFFCEQGYHLVRNNYDSLLITHIIKGTFTFVNGEGRHITAREGDTVILDCFKPHEYYTNDSFESIWIHVSGANSFELFKEIESVSGNLVKCRDAEHVKRILFRIHDGISQNNPSTELAMSLDIYKVFLELLNTMSIKSKSESSNEENIESVKAYIFSHLDENLSVARLAENVHMSASHFSRVFKQQTGFSPYDFVLICRLNRAKDLLKKTDMSVAQIADETGFNSESNFIYFFTANVGISPRKFRKMQF
ncbi:MAG: helix-turn-helix transcriptional regulator [Oscillospiraceae bacterium]|nr:helix-turn-helix transcriptional regulator [Oscillospiraceae bacterium]